MRTNTDRTIVIPGRERSLQRRSAVLLGNGWKGKVDSPEITSEVVRSMQSMLEQSQASFAKLTQSRALSG